jgi:3-hydroxyacyl-[acyl-carrier-protein] dehydratase
MGSLPAMRFTLIDRIDEIIPGERIVARKCLTMAEEYLDDHFPRFPVMPGVLMLETLTQASAWLIRVSENFAHSLVVLKEARNIKFAEFVQPGQVLVVGAEITKTDGRLTYLKAQGTVDERAAVGGRLILESYNQGDQTPGRASLDDYTRRWLRKQYPLIYPPAAAMSADAGN